MLAFLGKESQSRNQATRRGASFLWSVFNVSTPISPYKSHVHRSLHRTGSRRLLPTVQVRRLRQSVWLYGVTQLEARCNFETGLYLNKPQGFDYDSFLRQRQSGKQIKDSRSRRLAIQESNSMIDADINTSYPERIACDTPSDSRSAWTTFLKSLPFRTRRARFHRCGGRKVSWCGGRNGRP